MKSQCGNVHKLMFRAAAGLGILIIFSEQQAVSFLPGAGQRTRMGMRIPAISRRRRRNRVAGPRAVAAAHDGTKEYGGHIFLPHWAAITANGPENARFHAA